MKDPEDPTPVFHKDALRRIRELRSAALLAAEGLYRCAAALSYDGTPRESVADQITRHAERLMLAASGANTLAKPSEEPKRCPRCGLPRVTVRSTEGIASPTDRCVPVAYPVIGSLACWRHVVEGEV